MNVTMNEIAGRFYSDIVVLAYPDRRAGTGLSAFVEASAVTEQDLRNFLSD